ncbi:SHOCT domain-containing protein [Pseudophaeobacter flagellatus]|uniref:SHOCT domain-containing protein n=1 Tax=Pseudophaeobacter flagellatus TaxID=2899119 RepID=UPI001E3A666C|nr:SHOCT domain-containing protein [Pseudophaeobacter flagellatus]MCD9147332.1 SHOCT domain-containing protein [Pseudophaeobacter flagellatus]
MKLLGISNFALAVILATPAVADASGGYSHPHMYAEHGFGMFLGPVFMLVLLAALVVGIVALIRWMAPNAGFTEGKSNSALDALNLRFANGEIDAKEYAERKKLLGE